MTAAARRDVFQAIADPTRRAIMGLIAFTPLNLTAIAGEFDISRPAISQQIKILEECGLVSIKKRGRERYCHARFEALAEVQLWVNKYKPFWNDKLDGTILYILLCQTIWNLNICHSPL